VTKRTMATNRGRVWGKPMILPLGPGFFSVPQEVRRRPSHQTCSSIVSRVRVVTTVKQNTEYFVGPRLYYVEI